MGRPSAGQAVIYIVGMPSGPKKIGSAHNINRRLVALQTGNPEKLTVLWSSIPLASNKAMLVEKAVHRALVACQLFGEWFAISTESAVSTILAGIEDPGKIARAARSHSTRANKPFDPIGRCNVCHGPIRIGSRFCSAKCIAIGMQRRQKDIYDWLDEDMLIIGSY
jgi:hypothetical protein